MSLLLWFQALCGIVSLAATACSIYWAYQTWRIWRDVDKRSKA